MTPDDLRRSIITEAQGNVQVYSGHSTSSSWSSQEDSQSPSCGPEHCVIFPGLYDHTVMNNDPPLQGQREKVEEFMAVAVTLVFSLFHQKPHLCFKRL